MFDNCKMELLKKLEFITRFESLVTKIIQVRLSQCASMFRISECEEYPACDGCDNIAYVQYVAELTQQPDTIEPNSVRTVAWMDATVNCDKTRGEIQIVVETTKSDYNGDTIDSSRIASGFEIIITDDDYYGCRICVDENANNVKSFFDEVCDLDDNDVERVINDPRLPRDKLVEWFSNIVYAVDEVYGTHYYSSDNFYSSNFDELQEYNE